MDLDFLLVRRNEHETHVGVVAQRLVRADGGDHGFGIRCDWPMIHGGIPRIVRRENFQGGENGIRFGGVELERAIKARHFGGGETGEAILVGGDAGRIGGEDHGLGGEQEDENGRVAHGDGGCWLSGGMRVFLRWLFDGAAIEAGEGEWDVWDRRRAYVGLSCHCPEACSESNPAVLCQP